MGDLCADRSRPDPIGAAEGICRGGASDRRRPAAIVLRTILPNIVGPLIVVASFNLAGVILSEAALSFLGLGVPPTVPTWGGMLAESRDQLLGGYWWSGRAAGLGDHGDRAVLQHPRGLAARLLDPRLQAVV